jgi:pimeloyl-ACP methyl ester carboxylesterase
LDSEPELVISFDQTLIAARRIGVDGDRGSLLLVNGIGAGLEVWRRALVDIASERPVLTWDLRGLHESGIPRSERVDAGAQAEDALAVADYFGIERFAAVGWSSGTRIALELAHRYPDRVTSLILVCGAYGYPLQRALRHFEVVALLPSLAGVAKHFSTFFGGALGTLTTRPEFAGIVRQSGLAGPTADVNALVDLFKSMSRCDPHRLLATFEAVAGDAAPELAGSVEAPTLVVAGDRDQFTPLNMMEEMAAAIPDAHLEIYRRATHYLPIEFPDRLAEDMRAWLAKGERTTPG